MFHGFKSIGLQIRHSRYPCWGADFVSKTIGVYQNRHMHGDVLSSGRGRHRSEHTEGVGELSVI